MATYTACVLSLSPAVNATDIFCITGSATKTISIIEVCAHGTQTNPSAVAMQWVRRSTDNTGGTSSAPAAVPHDSSYAAATATVRAYTANPTTLGTLVGPVRTDRELVGEAIFGAIPISHSPRLPYWFDGSPINLSGASEILALNLSGATIAGGNFAIWITWIEG